MDYLISGSVVYDNILSFKGKFENFISSDAIDKLNVSLPLNKVVRELGGTGSNIYNIAQALNSFSKQKNSIFHSISPDLMTHLGKDSHDFVRYWESKSIIPQSILHHETEGNATCFIISSSNGNQITSFYSGALATPLPEPSLKNISNTKHVLLSPEYTLNTISIVDSYAEHKAKLYFDPGQNLLLFTQEHPEETIRILQKIHGLFVNEYEGHMLLKFMETHLGITGSLANLFQINPNLEFVVKTLGSKGVHGIYRKPSQNLLNEHILPVAQISQFVDPTGCGDSFRAGFFNKYLQTQDFHQSLVYGSVVSSFIAERIGCNLDGLNQEIIEERYYEYMKGI